MQASDVISQFPEEFISDVFERNKKSLLSGGAPKGDLQKKFDEYAKFFEFEKSVLELKNLLETNVEIEITDPEYKKVHSIVGILNNLKSEINRVDLTNTRNVDAAFKQFDQTIHDKGYLRQVMRTIDGVGSQPTGQVLIEKYIEDVQTLIALFKIRTFGLEKIAQVEPVVRELINNKKKYEEAASVAENWIQTQEKALGLSLKKPGIGFAEKAEEHRAVKVKLVPLQLGLNKLFSHTKQWHISGTFPWLLLAFLFGGLVMWIVFSFIHALENNPLISTGAAILRISAIIIPSYFIFFSTQQFLNHKKLYELYKFKDIALETMNDLVKLYGEPSEKSKILDQGLQIIFQEPILNESKLVQKELISDLKDIAKEKLK